MFESRPEARAVAQQLARYREPNNARGVFELMITAGPFFIISAVMWVVLIHGHWSGLLLMVPAAGLVVRLFMIRHDCGHGSFFHGRLANGWPRDRRCDPHALRLLATEPCAPSRELRQSRPKRRRRH